MKSEADIKKLSGLDAKSFRELKQRLRDYEKANDLPVNTLSLKKLPDSVIQELATLRKSLSTD